MAIWMSLEIFDGDTTASSWAEIFGDVLTEAALAGGALDWAWHRHDWGVIFEVSFPDEATWERFRATPLVGATLDAVPDPVSGLLVYRGRGGSSGRPIPRRPRPFAGCGAAALPLPEELSAPRDLWELLQGEPLPRRIGVVSTASAR